MTKPTLGRFDIHVIEQAAFMYLRAVSFNSITAIFQSWFSDVVFCKVTLIRHIEKLVHRLPSQAQITTWLKPLRSGYYALDGTWLKYRGRDFVLLIFLDVKTLDIINWCVATEEDEQAYRKLIQSVVAEMGQTIKGFFCDGDKGLLKALKAYYPDAPIQLCVFHRYARVGQIIPFIRVKNELDKELKDQVEAILFAPTKQAAIEGLQRLKQFAKAHNQEEKVRKILEIIRHNFELLLTHFDNPEMSPYNNTLEGFNYLVKRKTRLMKGFKKPINIYRWVKLIMLDWRFHKLTESAFKERRGKSPLELAGCQLPIMYNWMTYVRKNFKER